VTPRITQINVDGRHKKRVVILNFAITLWTVAVRDRRSVMTAYIDFAKAFDSVSHTELCHKLSAYGISGNLYKLLENFLTDRSQCTRGDRSLEQYTC